MQGRKSLSGSQSYKPVEHMIFSRGRELRIISPYISPYYMKMLLRISRRKSVYIITSPSTYDSLSGQFGIKAHRLGPKPLHGGILILISIFLALLSQYLLSLIALDFFGIWVIAYIISLFLSKKSRKNLHMKKTSGEFVHEKIYISDDEAIVGSANLTFSGMHKNIEHIELIKDPAEIKHLKSHFMGIWASAK